MANTYLQRTGISAGNRRIWTWSAWIKRTSIGEQRLFNHEQSSGTSQISVLKFDGNDNLLFADNTGSGNSINLNASLRKFRDTNAWYHIVMAVDTTLGTAADRVKIYINGERITQFVDNSTHNHPPDQNYQTAMNKATLGLAFGRAYAFGSGSATHFEGQMAELYLVDGAQLEATVKKIIPDAEIYFDENVKSTPLIDDQNDERIRKEIDFNPRSFEEGVKCLIQDVRESN